MQKTRQLFQDKSGVAAVEFALIFPVMVFLVMTAFVAFEIVRHDSFNRRIAGSLSDVLSRSEGLRRSELEKLAHDVERSFSQIGETFGMRVSSHIFDDEGRGAAVWVYHYGAFPEGDGFHDLPKGSMGESFILVEMINSYENVFPGLMRDVGEHWAIKVSSASRPRTVPLISITND
ncbi:hypothetical protein FE840_002595 [Peteryoungia desertarenae]|uniref:Pilus assembly protein n=1 Tax=Peteryoungia desertarenae TaxID=1813451 RepID=A0ABX6QJ15_9HYPH|nr:hypothetical protein [Peteryoungia desertarenae]QLF68528.1 hypothetical protein FE840_002595 [Peteryoungia desertarenae]